MKEKTIEIIKSILQEQGKVYVNELSLQLNVSKVSIRKYLCSLEDEGFASRFYGGASLSKDIAFKSKEEEFYKNSLFNDIAEAACLEIENGDSLFIGSGRTCCILAKKLSRFKNLTVVTNNITALPDLINNSSKVYLIGGEVTSTDTKTLFSCWETPKSLLENIFVKKAFTSTSGFDMKAGLTVDSIISTYIFKKIPSISQQWFIMSDFSKFNKIAMYSVADLSTVHTVISNGYPIEYNSFFKENGIKSISII